MEPEPCRRCATPIHPGFGWCPDCDRIEALISAAREAPRQCVSWKWINHPKRGTRTAVDCGECWACRLRAAVDSIDDAA